MTHHKKLILYIGTTGVLILGLMFWKMQETNSIAYHTRMYGSWRRLYQATSGPMEILSQEYLYWFIRGRPSFATATEARLRHEEALLKLGFFERRDFQLTILSLDQQSENRLRQMLSGGVFTNQWTMTRIFPTERVVRVTACPGDIKVAEQIILQFEKIAIADDADR